MVEVVLNLGDAAADNRPTADCPGAIPIERQQIPDYAARLRAPFQGAFTHALISREDAMGAAAEIEQLWAALWTTGNNITVKSTSSR